MHEFSRKPRRAEREPQVLFRTSSLKGGGNAPEVLWPSDVFPVRKEMWFNGESIQVIHQPSAHTDGDSIVYFRRSDVISAGDV